MKPRSLRFIILILLFAFIGSGCGGPTAAERAASAPVTIKIWRVFDDSSTFDNIMNAYRAIHPNVSFSYRELRYDEYEEELLRAFAEGTGPDIFSVHNTWMEKYKSLMEPMPSSVSIPYCETRGTIKKETVCTIEQEPTISQRTITNDYFDVVAKDVIRSYRKSEKSDLEDRIFGLPLGIDTLALYYNRDLLNAASIAEPPSTWDEFQDQVTTLTKLGSEDKVLQSGAAIGTSRNVERAFDILSVLMIQNGTQMTDSRGRATFGNDVDGTFFGGQAVKFYTDFANPLKQVYTWNDDMDDSFDTFINGGAAFFFGYSYHYNLIKSANEKMNLGIAALPQIENGKTANYANYWIETVAKSTDHDDWAWDFIEFAASKERVTSYLSAAKKPTALRSLVSSQLDDDVLSVFSNQTFTSDSWYRGSDAAIAEEAFLDLIDAFLVGEDQERALKDAQNKVNQTL